MNQYPPPSNTPTAWAPSSGSTANAFPQPQQGYGQQGFGPSQGYGPPQGYDPRAAEFAKLAEETRTWLIVAAVGWFVGFMWVMGPLAWYQATRIRDRYFQLGAAAPNEVATLRLVGIITTALSVFFVLAIFAVIFFTVVVAAASHHR